MLFLSRANKDVKMEKCYNLFEKYNWDLTKFRNDTDLLVEDVRTYAREYAELVLKESLTKEQLWCLMPTNIRSLFNDYDKIIKLMLENNVIDRNQLTDINWMIENLRANICKFCYDISEEHKWINVDIDEYCHKHAILPRSLKKMARDYTLEVLKLDEVEQEAHKDKVLSYRKNRILNNINESSGIFANLYVKLLQTKNDDEVIKLFAEVNRDFSIIKSGLMNIISAYNIPDNIKEELFNKLNIYAKYLEQNRNRIIEQKREETEKEYIENTLQTAVSVIEKYISDEYDDIDKFCNDIKLERRLFDKYLELVKNNDKNLYDNYLQYIENNKNKLYKDLLSRVLIVIDLIKQGVIENGIKRDFDLVDYYKYLPLGFDRTVRIVRDDINPEDYKLLCNYINKHKNERELSDVEINNIYNMKTIVNVKFDEENKVIPGTGREITKEEKQNIINYLRDNNIPVTNKTYNIIYRRWLSGELVIETNKDKTK